MTTQKTILDLTKYLSESKIKEFQRGVVYKGYWYWTDARLAIRIPTEKPDTQNVEQPKILSDLVKVGWDKIPESELGPLPKDPERLDNVRTCNHVCPDCGGSGKIICYECGSEKKCDYCEGEGKFLPNKCLVCHGVGVTGHTWRNLGYLKKAIEGNTLTNKTIGNAWVREEYFLVLRGLPNCQYAYLDDLGHARYIGTFDGGEFVVMTGNPGPGPERQND